MWDLFYSEIKNYWQSNKYCITYYKNSLVFKTLLCFGDLDYITPQSVPYFLVLETPTKISEVEQHNLLCFKRIFIGIFTKINFWEIFCLPFFQESFMRNWVDSKILLLWKMVEVEYIPTSCHRNRIIGPVWGRVDLSRLLVTTLQLVSYFL